MYTNKMNIDLTINKVNRRIKDILSEFGASCELHMCCDLKEGKRLRAKLLVNLKERSGLKYNEIIKFDLFVDLKISSLGRIYKNAKYINNQKK